MEKEKRKYLVFYVLSHSLFLSIVLPLINAFIVRGGGVYQYGIFNLKEFFELFVIWLPLSLILYYLFGLWQWKRMAKRKG